MVAGAATGKARRGLVVGRLLDTLDEEFADRAAVVVLATEFANL
jgi:hypothetical protein